MTDMLGTCLADGVFSPAAMAGLDRVEDFPDQACALLDQAGLSAYYAPAAFGGRLTDHLEVMVAIRAVARRDLTVAIAHGKTFLGTAPVWVGGEPEQARRLAAEVVDDRVVSWALTEPGHGADLLAGEVTADRGERGWTLRGTKWLVNNATRSDLLCVLARTGEATARGFSLFLVDKRALPKDSYECLPKILTHGIRGADISGIRFHDAAVEESALVGPVGGGLEIVLKTLQLTRTLCAGLSLGAGDQALSLALDFTRQRELYGRFLLDLPRVRRVLAESATALMIAEAVGVVAARAIHALTGELSVIAPVAKAFVPTIVDDVLADLGELLGVRAFLSEDHEHGRFAKLERDHRIVGIFDGSTAVNRHALINQFPALARAYTRGRCDPTGLSAATTLAEPLPAFDRAALRLAAPAGCSVVQGLAVAVTAVRERGGARLAALAEALLDETDALHRELREHRPSSGPVPADRFDLAQRYELCFAGAAVLHLWLAGESGQDTVPRACLSLVLRDLGVGPPPDTEAYDSLAAALVRGETPSLVGEVGRGQRR
jgi:alkylation response protein AidB-like acyl-CoA dehydrogenase